MTRFVPNRARPYDGQPVVPQLDTIQKHLNHHLQALEHATRIDALPDSRGRWKDDPTVYTGVGGVAFMYFRLYLHMKLIGNASGAQLMLDKCQQRLESCQRQLPRQEDMVSFFCSSGGIYALSAAVAHARGAHDHAAAFITGLYDLQTLCWSRQTIDEILFGRAGYLYCLFFVRQYAGAQVPTSLLQQVMRIMLQTGSTGRCRDWPAMWYCFEEPYLGAAHGMAGILYMLLQEFHLLCPEEQTLARDLVYRTLGLANLEGNYPPVLGEEARLVHWCHGAPGFVSFLLKAAEVFGDAKFKQAAAKACDVIWQQGLLQKGLGLCHGICGNAYAFLSMYRATRDPRYLHYAWEFCQATWDPQVLQHISTAPDRQRKVQGVPDAPYSLMEGAAGVICFYADMLRPEASVFPAYEL
uniref:Uncharacterized protein n=1 Tax=Eutreptiella gymnastica TaxID=73025 RepID=A0A7S1IH92_9EUGL|mmetsp:Transcript_17700/g.31408  ORF Transcript_17700/g.31408 Transcript_17700/m.31408 type:complete len:411 (+) Transcript_17700:43-1275(+)